jgi:hypothetical protein
MMFEKLYTINLQLNCRRSAGSGHKWLVGAASGPTRGIPNECAGASSTDRPDHWPSVAFSVVPNNSTKMNHKDTEARRCLFISLINLHIEDRNFVALCLCGFKFSHNAHTNSEEPLYSRFCGLLAWGYGASLWPGQPLTLPPETIYEAVPLSLDVLMFRIGHEVLFETAWDQAEHFACLKRE